VPPRFKYDFAPVLKVFGMVFCRCSEVFFRSIKTEREKLEQEPAVAEASAINARDSSGFY
jgi:hypothetical protein